MKSRWVLFYDGACPLCMRTQNKIYDLISDDIKLTAVDLNGAIAISKGYNKNSVVLETPEQNYYSYHAWLKILSKTKYKWCTHLLLRPAFILFYLIVSKNRKMIGKLIKK
jgi:predicted DCC family thiol-disulfide oxidoreductase YuxK